MYRGHGPFKPHAILYRLTPLPQPRHLSGGVSFCAAETIDEGITSVINSYFGRTNGD
jgi:hypothetical protein